MWKSILIGCLVLSLVFLVLFILAACKVAGEYDDASERQFQEYLAQKAKQEEDEN